VGEWSSPVGKVAVELSEDSHSGKYCAKVSSISGNSNIYYIPTLSRKVEGEHTFRLKWFFKTSGDAYAFSYFRTFRSNGRELQGEWISERKYKGADDWTEVTEEFTTHPDTKELEIYFRSSKPAVWYDDVSLEEIKEEANPAEIVEIKGAKSLSKLSTNRVGVFTVLFFDRL
ncbi:MAG: carbohydrate binding domain-containing protein, partial [Candidatus Methanofastidiosia archaeon]